jgi:3-oxoadipate enol-lactonase
LLAFSDEGSGLPVILLHAFPLHRKMWEAQISVWRSCFRVIAPDFQGFGASAPGAEEARLESFADDVFQLLKSLQLSSPVVLVGLSMGGYVAFEFARKYPQHLCGLVLAATQPINDSAQARQARYETADLVRREGTGILADRMLPRLLGQTTREKKPEVEETVRRLIQDNPAKGVAKACYALAARRDSTPVLANIRVPVLIVAGAEDSLIPERQLQVMQKEIPQAHSTVIGQSGHLVNLEQPEEFNRSVGQFLESL